MNPQICPQILGQIRPQIWGIPKFVPKFRDKFVPKFVPKKLGNIPRIFLNIFRQIGPITRLTIYMYNILFHNLFVILDTFLQFCHWNQLFGIRLSRSVPCDNCRVGVAWKKNSLFPKKDLTWKSFPSFFKSSFFFLLCRGSSELLETHLARNLLQRFQQSAQRIWILTYLVSYIIGYILI